MSLIFGREITRDALLRSVGDMSQLCGIQSFTFDDGAGKGVRALELRTGSGLRLIALPDRCMDLYLVEFRGVSLNWLSGTGPVAPAFYSAHGWEWLHGFFGGLLTTCGLSNVGDPCEDRGAYLEKERFGGHGRISNTPAVGVGYSSAWEGERYLLSARGRMIETAAQGEKFVLDRMLNAEMGISAIEVQDTIVNECYTRVPFELLYHINVGFPILDAGARILARCSSVSALDAATERSIPALGTIHEPSPDAPEMVFLMEMEPDGEGQCSVALVNPGFDAGRGLGVYLRYPRAAFPYFNLWKRLSPKEYVVGFEPGNCTVQGRVRQRERGDLRYLAPGEQARSAIGLGVLASNEEIDGFARAHALAPL